MVSFRRIALTLAVLALFAGMAVAQTGTVTPLSCSSNPTGTPPLRAEGYTEVTGDLVITCTGGNQIAALQPIPLVNITVAYNTTVTSRLFNSNGISEALLLIDEPGSGLAGGFGPSLPQLANTTPLTGASVSGCTGITSPAVVGSLTTAYGTSTYTPTCNTGTVGAPVYQQVPNVYQGVVNSNQVTFFGVPVLPPGTVGSRVFRITNVRVNANLLGAGVYSGTSSVTVSISTSGSTYTPITQPTTPVGFISAGLSTSVSNANTTQAQCISASKVATGLLTFSENFGTSFKTRVVPQVNTAYAGQNNTVAVNVPPYFTGSTPNVLNQNTPGNIYNSESNFIFPLTSTGVPTTGTSNGIAGLADYGTRLKAVFNNIPSGVNVFVSVANVSNLVTPAVAPAVIGGTAITSYAQLVSSETINDGNAGSSGFFPSVANTDNAGTVGIAPVTISGGTGQAVWEVVNTNPNTNESLSFGVFITYTSNVAQSIPAIGTSTVNLSYAATATSGAASTSLTIPRFISDTLAARTLLTINLCRTVLLYPYITNQQGFDTGLTVANTSQDSFTVGKNVTPAQTGSCVFTWYGGTTAAPTTPPAPTTTPTIPGGTVWAGLASTLVPTYQGYAFAVCNFQFAHGFAFISDLGARNLAMGYLAVVLTDPGVNARTANGGAANAEWGGH